MRRFIAVLVAVVAVAGCGGDSTGVQAPKYPTVQGVYDYDATINGLPTAKVSGTLTVVDANPADSTFTGTFVVTLSAPGAASESFTGDLTNGAVDPTGSIRFDFGDPAYHNVGTLANSVVTGTWVLRGDETFTGSFTAVHR